MWRIVITFIASGAFYHAYDDSYKSEARCERARAEFTVVLESWQITPNSVRTRCEKFK